MNRLERDFRADAPNTRSVTENTSIETPERTWLRLCIVLDLHRGVKAGWSTSAKPDRELAIRAVMMALRQFA